METRFTDDMKAVTVPTLVLHGDGRIVPIDDSARLAAKLLKNGTLKVIAGAPRGMCSTNRDEVNAALLAFAKVQEWTNPHPPGVFLNFAQDTTLTVVDDLKLTRSGCCWRSRQAAAGVAMRRVRADWGFVRVACLRATRRGGRS